MNITFIGPNIITQKGDFFGSGIPYFPLVTAYAASYMRAKNHNVTLIDAFGENPFQVTHKGNQYFQGLTPIQVTNKINKNTDLICIGAERVVAHGSIINIIKAIRKNQYYKKTYIAILENAQAVTAYSLKKVKEKFFKNNVDFLITGDPEERLEKLSRAIKESTLNHNMLKSIDGIIYLDTNGKVHHNERKGFIKNPDILPFPAWDLIKVENYWKIRYAHAPLTSGKYLPLLTSRGCPYPCTFCVVPDINNQRWRPRSPKNVVDEIEHFMKKYDVYEFHLEDLNPTIRKQRMVDISKEILKRKLTINWKIASGTKAETMDEETIRWMARSGCTYISISPESGSRRIMKMIKKPFPYDRVLELIKEMQKNGIFSQACFILGYPGEHKTDIKKTNSYIKEVAKAGIDEIAILILTPIPGSAIFDDYASNNELDDITKLTFSPIWRKDYKKYQRERIKSYLIFLFWRFLYHPFDVFKQVMELFTKRFNTKVVMTLYRMYKVWYMYSFLHQYKK